MQAVKTIGLDIAKSGFQVHGVDADGQDKIAPQDPIICVIVFRYCGCLRHLM
jgi:hypothetical protein